MDIMFRRVQLAIADIAVHEPAGYMVGVGQRAVNRRQHGDRLAAGLAWPGRPCAYCSWRISGLLIGPAVHAASNGQRCSAGQKLATGTTQMTVLHWEVSSARGHDAHP